MAVIQLIVSCFRIGEIAGIWQDIFTCNGSSAFRISAFKKIVGIQRILFVPFIAEIEACSLGFGNSTAAAKIFLPALRPIIPKTSS